MSPQKEAFIVSAARTPIGSFRGVLSSLAAKDLGSIVIREALVRAGISGKDVDEVYFGLVLSDGLGQGPTRQAVLGAGLPVTTPCTTINKLCSSGMKTIALSAQTIWLGDADVMIAGGMESMSNTPFILPRGEIPYGGTKLVDALLFGLTDHFTKQHMGLCTERAVKEYGLTREEQDAYARRSYERSIRSQDSGLFKKEIVPVSIERKRGKDLITEDEEVRKTDLNKLATMRPVFKNEGGTITAGNASGINDGAAATVIMSANAVKKFAVKPLAKIIAFADAATEPELFSIAPIYAIPKVLEKAGLNKSDIAHWEINEAFSAVPLAAIKHLGLDPSLVNPNGGAVSMGHPVGSSGARIVNHLALHMKTGDYGLAAICNGGGGASAMIVKKL